MKKILSMYLTVLLLAGFLVSNAEKACAGEAVRIYVEFDSTTAMAKISTLFARVVALDVNDELATTFAGSDIDQASIKIVSQNYAEEVTFYDTTAALFSSASAAATAASDGTVTLSLAKAWKEIAVSYASVTEVMNDTIQVTFVKGSSILSSTRGITVLAPPANCYVVKTGGVGVAPEVFEEISATRQNDHSAVKKAGHTITVDVFAAYYVASTGKYYFTTNVPSGAEVVTLSGRACSASVQNQQFAYSGSLTLANGRATVTTPAITNLKIPECLVRGYLGTTQAAQKLSMAWVFINGVTLTFSATTNVTRSIGTRVGDVEAAGGTVSIKGSSSGGARIGSGSPSGVSCTDTAHLTPEILDTVNMIGLPVNALKSNGSSAFAGFGGIVTSSYTPVAADAYFLASDWKKQASFKTFGQTGAAVTNKIFCAILGRDIYNNPAPFDDAAVTFTVNYGTGVDLGWNINRAQTGDSADSASTLAASANQAFLPFAITYTGAPVSAAITEVYLSVTTGALAKATALDGIKGGTSDKMMSFYIQDKIGAITATQSATSAGATDNKLSVQAASGNTEQFYVSGIFTPYGTAMGIGGTDATTSGASITVSGDGEEENDVTIFTANEDMIYVSPSVYADAPFILKITGASSGVTAVQAITPTVSVADAGYYPPSMIVPYISAATVNMDEEESHNEITLAVTASSMPVSTACYQVLDAFGNPYPSYALNNAEAEAAVYVAADNGSATATLFPGASAMVAATDAVELKFNNDNITKDQRKAVLKVTAGASSASTLFNLNVAKQLMLDTVFVPVSDIDDTPLKIYIADQNGKVFTPVTTTSVLAGVLFPYEGSVAVDVKPTDGKINGSTNQQRVYVTTSKPAKIVTINPDTGKNMMTIDGFSDYGNAKLVVNFSPDFNAPVIGASLTAIDCGFEVIIIDDVAVDAAATTLTVKNASGEDITSTLTVSTLSDNGTKAVIKVLGTGTGSFLVNIIAKDKARNSTTSLRIVSIQLCSSGPECSSVDPSFAMAGSNHVLVTVKGNNTHFINGTTSASFSCPGIVLNSLTVYSSTELTADVSVADTVSASSCSITVTTGNEQILCNNVFEIIHQTPCEEYDDGSLDILGRKGFTGSSVLHTVRINNAPNDVSSFGFDIAYDTSFLRFENSANSSRMNDYNFICTGVSPGLIRCGGYENAAATSIQRGDSCDLVDMSFTVLQTPCETGMSTALTLDTLVDDMRGWTQSQGCFKCQCPCDLNGNGNCTPMDAMWRFVKYLNGYGNDSFCYDVTGDGKITPADALCTMRNYLGIHPNCFD